MRKLKCLYLIFGILLYLSCEKPKELDFFEAETGIDNMSEMVSSSQLGEITLTGRIDRLITISHTTEIVSQGFIGTTDLEMIQDSLQNLSKREAMRDGQIFTLDVNNLNLNSTYYFRAYVEGVDEVAGTRFVYSDIEEFIFDVEILISTEYDRINNLAVVKGELLGLDSPDLISEYGFFFSQILTDSITDETIVVTADDLNSNNCFTDTLRNLDFNTLYYVRSWAKNVSGTEFSSENVLELQVTDGWRSVSNLPTTLVREGLAKAIAVPNGNGAIVGLGSYEDSFSSDIFYRFSLEENDILGTWDTSIPTDIASNRNDCIAFSYDNSLFVGLGENSFPNQTPLQFIRKLDLSTFTWSASGLDGTPVPLTSSVSFIIENKLYVGTGSLTVNDSEMTEKFWEIDLDNPQEWREVASLPLKRSPVDITVNNIGRYEAINFEFNGSHYVGGGFVLGEGVVSDLWKFIPPIDENDMGTWEPAGFLPGSSRYLAVTLVQNNRVYYGMGDSFNNGELSDWWEYMSDGTWEERTPLPAFGRSDAVTFATGEVGIQRGFLGTGTVRIVDGLSVQRQYLSDFWEYIPANQ